MKLKELQLKANQTRVDIINMVSDAGSGHPAGALGLVDLFTVLYSKILKYNPKRPLWKDRDFVFLSNGHTCAVLYSTLCRNGYYGEKELTTFRKFGSKLQGHPHFGGLKGVENSGGPLGQGISQAVGLASSLRRDNKKNNVYCFVGDGELEEGQCWEAFMYAAKENLGNLIVIVDENNIQIDGPVDDVLNLKLLHKKFTSFGFSVIDIEGNNLSQIEVAFKEAKKIVNKPVVILAKTISGKGVSFMEKDFHWHGKAPNKEEREKALNELKVEREKIEKGEI